MRRSGGAREIFGKGAANEGRGIIEEPRQDKFCFLALGLREIALRKGAREHACPLRALHRRSGPCPFQESTSRHRFRILKHLSKISFLEHGKGKLNALLEHVPKKLLDFFDKDMLQLFATAFRSRDSTCRASALDCRREQF